MLSNLILDIINVNTDMWHAQEVAYDNAALEAMTKEEILSYLKRATRLNIERNHAIDRLDREIEACRTQSN